MAPLSVTVNVSSSASSTVSSAIGTRISCAAVVPEANVSFPLAAL